MKGARQTSVERFDGGVIFQENSKIPPRRDMCECFEEAGKQVSKDKTQERALSIWDGLRREVLVAFAVRHKHRRDPHTQWRREIPAWGGKGICLQLGNRSNNTSRSQRLLDEDPKSGWTF